MKITMCRVCTKQLKINRWKFCDFLIISRFPAVGVGLASGFWRIDFRLRSRVLRESFGFIESVIPEDRNDIRHIRRVSTRQFKTNRGKFEKFTIIPRFLTVGVELISGFWRIGFRSGSRAFCKSRLVLSGLSSPRIGMVLAICGREMKITIRRVCTKQLKTNRGKFLEF